MTDAQLTVVLQAKDEATAAINKLNGALGETQASTKKSASGFGQMAGAFAVGGIAAQAAGAAFSFVKDSLGGCIAAAQEAELGQAQLTAVLASTGMQAGVTANMANELASSLSRTTTFSDDQILSAENLALTYTMLSSEVFPDVIKTATDMSTALGQDLRSSTDLLGKALQNPIEGTARLTKIGVNFTDAQKNQIKTMQEAGNVMGAQKVILGELSTEYGGSATAAADTYTGRMEQLKNSMGEIQENIGKALLPAMKPLIELFLGQANAAQDASAKTSGLAKFLYGLASVIKGVILVVIGIIKTVAGFGVQLAQTATVVGAFAKDVLLAFVAIKNAAKNIFAGIGQAAAGNFAAAKEEFDKAFDISITLENTKAALGSFQGTIDSLTAGASASFAEAGAAFNEAFVQKGFVPVSDAIDATKRKAAGGLGDIGEKAKKTAEEIGNVTKKVNELAANVGEKLADIVKTYTQRSAELLSAHKDRLAEINGDIAKETAEFDKQTLEGKKGYQEEVIGLFIDQQNKLKELQDEQAAIQKEMKDPNLDPEDRKKNEEKLSKVEADLKTQATLMKQYQNEFSNIEQLAADERSKTELDKAKARFLNETTERQAEHDAKIKDLQQKTIQELVEYQKAKDEIVADTVDKYEKLAAETSKGWQKIIDDTKLKVAEMKALEQQVQAIKASIEAARASIGAAGGGGGAVGARADGGPVTVGEPYIVGERGPEMFIPARSGTIVPNEALGGSRPISVSVMEGATVNVSGQADERRLAQTIASTIARALQSQRNGLATAF